MKKTNKVLFREDLEYQRNLLYTSFEVRIFGILVGFICSKVFNWVLGVSVPKGVIEIFYIWIFTCTIYLFLFRSGILKTRKIIDNVHLSYYVPAIIYVTALVHFLGGAEWIAFFLYFFDLVYGNVLMNRARGLFLTLYTAVCYFTLIILEYQGIIPHRRLFDLAFTSYDNLRYLMITNVMIIGVTFFIISYSTGLFARMKEEREKKLIESKNRFAVKSEQLENISRSLTRQVAENKYLKRATMGYIEKKEFELGKVKKDLEDQIEKLRKTQQSMFFMIEDLNEMGVQLKDARDHLEDKVRERTDELLNISRKLHRSERLAFLGKLAGSVTHELRNPLAVLKNTAYFLDKKFKKSKDAKVTKYIEVMKKEITAIDSIIDDIMGFARTKAPKLEDVDLESVVENAIIALNIPDLVKVKKSFEKLPEINIDRDQIMHALINLANNAIVAMNGNGTLTFRIVKKEKYACIEVEDTGPGIPPDQRELIFEPLYSSKPKGTGLGLPIAKMMIENQEGRLEFTSKLGKGTTFMIFLPLERKFVLRNN